MSPLGTHRRLEVGTKVMSLKMISLGPKGRVTASKGTYRVALEDSRGTRPLVGAYWLWAGRWCPRGLTSESLDSVLTCGICCFGWAGD